jgi:putative DNA primase/helicase
MSELPPDLELLRASEVRPQPVRWLWRGRIARGKVTMLAGHPGLGKSQVGLNFVAAMTAGGRWPDGTSTEPSSALILSAEDDAEDTIRPRLEAAGADLKRCHIVGAVREAGNRPREFCLIDDLGRLATRLDEIGDAALIVIDPISAYLGKTDSHRNAEVRAVLAPLAELAARYRAAVLAVSHLRKSPEGDAILRVSGSLAFVAAARAAYLVMRDPNDRDRRLLLPLKNNLGIDSTGYAYRVVAHWLASSEIATCRVEWEPGVVTISADEALGATRGGREDCPKLDAAMEWLSELLSTETRAQAEVQAAAKAARHAWATVRRAADELGVEKIKSGWSGGWVWSLTGDLSPGGEVEL